MFCEIPGIGEVGVSFGDNFVDPGGCLHCHGLVLADYLPQLRSRTSPSRRRSCHPHQEWNIALQGVTEELVGFELEQELGLVFGPGLEPGLVVLVVVPVPETGESP